jgi:hypothetical protein
MICPAFCCFIYGSAAAMTYSTLLMFTSIVRAPVVNLESLKRRMRHQPSIIEHDIDVPKFLHGGINQAFHLVVVGASVARASALQPLVVNSAANDWGGVQCAGHRAQPLRLLRKEAGR